MKKLLFIIGILNSTLLFSQSKLSNNWITGYSGNRINFNNVLIKTESGLSPFKNFTGGNSCISDTNGSLILYSNGFHIFNNSGNYLDNGDTLVPPYYFNIQNGSSFGSQTSIFLPMDNNKYYFVTPTFSDTRYYDCHNNGGNCYFDLLLYNTIDMNANAGLGKVTQRMIPLMQNANLRKTQMMACRHANGKDWWLLKQEGDSANVHTFLFAQDSVYDKGLQVFNKPVWGVWDIRGQSTFNSDGSQYASTSHSNSSGYIFMANFDRCYGILNYPYVIQMPLGSQHNPNDTTLTDRESLGLSFSPNGKFLYVISYTNIYQYDLSDSTWFHVAGLDTFANAAQGYKTAYLGPDNKIYIGNLGGLSKQMSRIDNPDVKGIGCNFCPRCLRLDTLGANAYVGTPPCMPNYSLGAKECWPLEVSTTNKEEPKLKSYPNPTSTSLTIELTANKKALVPIEMYNMMGELVLRTEMQSQSKVQINISSLPKGVYVIRCEGVSLKVVIE